MVAHQELVLECEQISQNQKRRRMDVEAKVAQKRSIVAQILRKMEAMIRWVLDAIEVFWNVVTN
jgi:hypothetical protein